MLTRNSRRALSEKTDNEEAPAKRRRFNQESKTTIVKMEAPACTESKRKIKVSQTDENCDPGPSSSRTRILHRHSRQALSERVNNKGSQEKKPKVERASKKNKVKNEISEQLEKEMNTENSPPKKHKVTRVSKRIVAKSEFSENIDITSNIKTSPPTNNLNRCTQRNSGVKKESSPLSLGRSESEEGSIKENIDNTKSKKVKKEKSRKAGLKKEHSEPHTIEMNVESLNNIENCYQVPSTSKEEDSDVKKDLLPESANIEENNILDSKSLLDQEEAMEDNNESIVELEVPQKVVEEVLLSDDEEEMETRKIMTTPVNQSVETNLTQPISEVTNGNPICNEEETLVNNDDSIVEVEVPKKVVEEVLLSDDEDKEIETRKRSTTQVESSVPSGSILSTSQAGSSSSHNKNIEVIKIEDPSPQSAVTPKRKNLVLDPSVLTPPTGNLQENAAKLWKCMLFLEQSELNPDAKEFVPSPKVAKKVAEDPKPTDCIICLEPRETTFVNMPCRHAVTCGPCSDQLELLGKDCPVCRTPIQSRFQIYN